MDSPNFDAIALSLVQSRGDAPLDIVRRVRAAYTDLPDRDQEVLCQRFRAVVGDRATLAEIADRMPGLTAERVRSIESRALNSLLQSVYGGAA